MATETILYNNIIKSISISATGTTTDAYVNLIEWACPGYSKKTIIIKNTDAANSLTYKVLVYAHDGSTIYYEEVSDTALAFGNVALIDLQKAYARIEVAVKSTVLATPATVQCDVSGCA